MGKRYTILLNTSWPKCSDLAGNFILSEGSSSLTNLQNDYVETGIYCVIDDLKANFWFKSFVKLKNNPSENFISWKFPDTCNQINIFSIKLFFK